MVETGIKFIGSFGVMAWIVTAFGRVFNVESNPVLVFRCARDAQAPSGRRETYQL
ncbi:hypothetical protein FEAC_12880 [Ferrimicrobium acidiphilum DSM 19497]|uniref:Uncharacterized protein n=1 Tax=Ferrimicrobium acidiphilum DSM 19497 TaxID=1121877 RepID=A0A0D8FUK0_9ACTN|nr:hypothetical protein FEAC_12880 [Ferrimicrobium acidiphilum DSM 19497]